MAIKHVVAYFMHESEESDALQVMAAAERTESYVMGQMDDSQIPALERKGLIVRVQSEPVGEAPSARPARDDGAFSFGAEAGVVDAPGNVDEAVPAPVDYYLLSVRGPVTESRREQLHAAGATLCNFENGVYKVRLHRNSVAAVKALPFILKVHWISPERFVPDLAAPSSADFGIRPGAAEILPYDARLNQPTDLGTVLAWLTSRGAEIIGSGSRKIRFRAKNNSTLLDDLNALPGVARVEPYVEPELFNNAARRLLGVNKPFANGSGRQVEEDGTGQIVAVADTGIDDQHPDFQGRIAGTAALGRQNDHSDPDGHGTHVAGSILGNGSASNGELQGVAPGAKLYFQSLLDASGRLGGLPVNLSDLFEQAYIAGARIHNNSWGSKTPSSYTANSEEVDEFIHNRKDMLLVIAAGNAGSGNSPKKADPGFVDWLSIGAPGSCKNALTVGASRSDRTDGAFSAFSWTDKWPTSFPTHNAFGNKISGDPECLAAFSSRGPCDDHRIKPDVVAPGTDIASTKSSLAPDGNFWGPFPGNDRYAFDGGTSMATPLVSGCAALIRQYYVDKCNHPRPSAALLKATLVNSTTWLSGDDANAKVVGKPNYHQGHGRVSVNQAYPNPSQPGMELRFVDEWETFQFSRTGQRKRYQFILPADIPELRVCMAYTDAPARGLQNNVNLMLQYLDGAEKHMGNEAVPDQLILPDPDNNLETIRIQNAKMGTYLIQVFVSNLLKPPQDFALVVTGIGVPALDEV